MKKIAFLLSVVLALTTVTACGSGGASDTASDAGTSAAASTNSTAEQSPAATQSTEKVSIEFWTGLGGLMQETLQEFTDEFNTSQDKYVINQSYQGNYYDLSAKLQASIASGTSPTLCQMEIARTVQYAQEDTLLDMRSFIEADSFDLTDFQEGLMPYSYNGDEVISLPFNRSTPLFYYNKDHFREAGLDPEKGPATWEELKEYAQKLTIPGERWGLECPIDAWFYEAFIMQSDSQILSPDNKTIAFNNEAGTAGLHLWKDMIDAGTMKVPPGKEYDSWDVARQDFSNGSVSMAIIGTGDLGTLASMSDIDIGACFLPMNKRYGVPTGGANLMILQGHTDAENAAAWEMIKFLLRTENSAKWSSVTGYVPVLKSAAESDTFQKYLEERPAGRAAIEQLQYTDIARPKIKDYNEIQSVIMSEEIQRCILDGATPEEAVANIARRVEELLK